MKEFAHDNSEFDENGRKFYKRVENTFPTVFSKDLYYRHVNNQGLFGKGLNLCHTNSLRLSKLKPKGGEVMLFAYRERMVIVAEQGEKLFNREDFSTPKLPSFNC